jgi:uncharacterized membrane protein YidH (DUF202 family)
MAGPRTSGDAWTRTLIALVVVGAALVSIVVISAVAIALADDASETSRLVFTSVLPLLGTWVGTVLAFYFARENLEAATTSTLALSGRETTTPVTNVMIPEADFVAYDLGPEEQVDTVKLATVREKMREIDPPSRRLPMRDASRAVLYVIHDSTLSAFADKQGTTIDEVEAKTVGDFVADPEFKALIEANGYIAENATVADARRVMASIEYCNDVFVTSTGKRDERAIGWLTNTLLAGVQ